ncbi:MAG: dTMP kinase [Candidatus Omnitrophota bacterium]
MKNPRAFIISFEGIEGAGKSTQCRLLAQFLKKKGFKIKVFREPGSSSVGEKIRDILLHSKGKLTHFCETVLFIAARNQLQCEKILPILAKKDMIILDRYIDATSAYQGYGSGVDLNLIKNLNKYAAGDVIPDITILMDIDVQSGIARCGRGDRFERRKLNFHEKVRKGYLKIAKQDPERIKIVSAKGEIASVQADIRRLILNAIKRKKYK